MLGFFLESTLVFREAALLQVIDKPILASYLHSN